MSFKFKPGDLVEVIRSETGRSGHRFIINNADVLPSGDCYETDVKSDSGTYEFKWAREDQLKLVNPDIDAISEFKFSELMDEITEAITVAK